MVDINPVLFGDNAIYVGPDDTEKVRATREAFDFWLTVRAFATLTDSEKNARGLVRLFNNVSYPESMRLDKDSIAPENVYVPSEFATVEFAKAAIGPTAGPLREFNAYIKSKDDEKVVTITNLLRASPKYMIINQTIKRVEDVCDRLGEDRTTGSSMGHRYKAKWIVGEANLRANIVRVAEYAGTIPSHRNIKMGENEAKIGGSIDLVRGFVEGNPRLHKTYPDAGKRDLLKAVKPFLEGVLEVKTENLREYVDNNSEQIVNLQTILYRIIFSDAPSKKIIDNVFNSDSVDKADYDKFEDFMHVARACFAEMYNMKMRNYREITTVKGYRGDSSSVIVGIDILTDMTIVSSIGCVMSYADVTSEGWVVAAGIGAGIFALKAIFTEIVRAPPLRINEKDKTQYYTAEDRAIAANEGTMNGILERLVELSDTYIPSCIKEVIAETSDDNIKIIIGHMVLRSVEFYVTANVMPGYTWLIPMLVAEFFHVRIQVKATTIIVKSLSTFISRLTGDFARGGKWSKVAHLVLETITSTAITSYLSSPFSGTRKLIINPDDAIRAELPVYESRTYASIMNALKVDEYIRSPYIMQSNDGFLATVARQLATPGKVGFFSSATFASVVALVCGTYVGYDLSAVTVALGITIGTWGYINSDTFDATRVGSFVNRISSMTIEDTAIRVNPTSYMIVNANTTLALNSLRDEPQIHLSMIKNIASKLATNLANNKLIESVSKNLNLSVETGSMLFAWAILAFKSKSTYKAINDSFVLTTEGLLPPELNSEIALTNLATKFSSFTLRMGEFFSGVDQLDFLAGDDHRFLSFLSLRWVSEGVIPASDVIKKQISEILKSIIQTAIESKSFILQFWEGLVSSTTGFISFAGQIAADAISSGAGLQGETTINGPLGYAKMTISWDGFVFFAFKCVVGALILAAIIRFIYVLFTKPADIASGIKGIITTVAGWMTAPAIYIFDTVSNALSPNAKRTNTNNAGPSKRPLSDDEPEEGEGERIKRTRFSVDAMLEMEIAGIKITINPHKFASMLVLADRSLYVLNKINTVRDLLGLDLSSNPTIVALLDIDRGIEFPEDHPCHIPLQEHMYTVSESESATQPLEMSEDGEVSNYYRMLYPDSNPEKEDVQTRTNKDILAREVFPHLVDLAIISLVLDQQIY